MSIKSLVSETALYGLSSILGRGLYFLLTPLYTTAFATEALGIQTNIFSYISVLMVLATLRIDVAFFRFYDKNNIPKLLGTSILTIACIGIGISSVLLLASGWLAQIGGYPTFRWLFILASGIFLFDALTEIPLAKLRMEKRPIRFIVVRLSGIIINLSLNLFWLYFLPKWPDAPSWLATPFSGITYIFLANLVSSLAVFLLVSPELKNMEWRIDFKLLRSILSYSFPLVIVGLSYTINEMFDRQMLPILWPGGKQEGLSQLGIYGQNYKLAMLLALFTQAFRYGAEPFFFRERKSADAKTKYALVAHYFLIAALLGFLIVSLFLPIFSQLFLKQVAYRQGSDVVPILLLANLCLGLYYNFSVWFKVTDATKYGAYISLGGAALTILLNLLFIPEYGFYGCAWATLICYSSMCIASVYFGNKRYPIPYPAKRMIAYSLLALGLFLAYWFGGNLLNISCMQLAIDGGSFIDWIQTLGFATLFLITFVSIVLFSERKYPITIS